MEICHAHNLAHRRETGERQFGIRLTLPEGDSFRRLLGDDWESYRWYDTERERDAAFDSLKSKHPFSRIGDLPTHVLEKVSG